MPPAAVSFWVNPANITGDRDDLRLQGSWYCKRDGEQPTESDRAAAEVSTDT
jgi:hypothetical protein